MSKKKMFIGKTPALHDPIFAIQSDQLLALLLTPHHPLGKQFVDFIDQFKRRFAFNTRVDRSPTVTLGDDVRIMVQEVSMANAVSGLFCFSQLFLPSLKMTLLQLLGISLPRN